MKKILYLVIVLILTSCGPSSYKVGNLEVMSEDLGQMTWDEADIYFSDLGEGWRLPTLREILILEQNHNRVNMSDTWCTYWTSAEGDNRAYSYCICNGNGAWWDKSTKENVRGVRTY